MTNAYVALTALSKPVRQVLIFAATTALLEKEAMNLSELHRQFNQWRDHEFRPHYVNHCFRQMAQHGLVTFSIDHVTMTDIGLQAAKMAHVLALTNALGFENILPSHQPPATSPVAATWISPLSSAAHSRFEHPLLKVAPLGIRPLLPSQG